jgi:hypothetical protein
VRIYILFFIFELIAIAESNGSKFEIAMVGLLPRLPIAPVTGRQMGGLPLLRGRAIITRSFHRVSNKLTKGGNYFRTCKIHKYLQTNTSPTNDFLLRDKKYRFP